MSWNYRITRETARGVTYYALREVYYDDDGRPEGWSAAPVRFTGDTPQDIVEDLLLAASAWSRGVLDLDTRETVRVSLSGKEPATHDDDLAALADRVDRIEALLGPWLADQAAALDPRNHAQEPQDAPRTPHAAGGDPRPTRDLESASGSPDDEYDHEVYPLPANILTGDGQPARDTVAFRHSCGKWTGGEGQ